jgi:hypothetical protein
MHNVPVLDPQTAKLALYGTKVGVDKHNTHTSARGTTVVESVQVFKTGTFKDSWGDQQTWTQTHIEQMALHFRLLKDAGVFPDVPVRNDHSFSVTDVIGYFEDLRVDGDFLVADLEFTDSTALEKFDNGTYRSRSIEIGLYETNDGQTYYPVVMGLAFVDIPAVEGLHGRPKTGIATFRQENQVPDAPAPTTTPAAPATPPAATFTFNLAGKGATTDFAAVQAHITQIEGEKATLLAQNTQYEADFAKAEAEARKTFVNQLATDKKIIGPQVEPTIKLVETMSAEQFEMFKTTFSAAPQAAILTPHADAATANHTGAQPPAADAPLAGEELHYEKVAQFRLAGMSDEQIWKTKTGQALKQLGKTTLDK